MRHLNRVLILVSCLTIGHFGGRVEAADQDLTVAPRYGEAVSLLETWIQSIVDYDRLPGLSLAIVQDQAIVYAKGFGSSDLDRHVNATPETVYSICSISKIFTGIAVMQLRDAGKLNLDDPVDHYLPWFQPDDPSLDSQRPTLRDLLRHSGGLPCEPDRTVWTEPDRSYPSREELIERVSSLKMSVPANTKFNYSNLGYSLLGEVVAAVSGMEYADYVRQHILEPLSLDATTPYMPGSLPGREIAKGYGPWPRHGSRIDIVNSDQKAMTPASGFASTVGDMAKLAMWQFRVLEGENDAVLNRQTLLEMYSIQWPEPTWGLGFSIWHMGDKDFVGHQGGCPGYKSQLIICPEEKIAVVVMVNATDAPQFTLVFRSFEIMAPFLTGLRPKETEQNAWAEYAGFYTSDTTWSDAEVLSWHDNLAVMWVPGGNPDPIGSLTMLTRAEGEVFREVSADGELGKHYIFSRDAEGNVVGLKFNNNVLTKKTADRRVPGSRWARPGPRTLRGPSSIQPVERAHSRDDADTQGQRHKRQESRTHAPAIGRSGMTDVTETMGGHHGTRSESLSVHGVNRPRPDPGELNRHRLVAPDEMSGPGPVDVVVAGFETGARRLVDGVPETDVQCPLEHRDPLVARVRVKRQHERFGGPNPEGEELLALRVSLEDGHPAPFSGEGPGRTGAPLDRLRVMDDLVDARRQRGFQRLRIRNGGTDQQNAPNHRGPTENLRHDFSPPFLSFGHPTAEHDAEWQQRANCGSLVMPVCSEDRLSSLTNCDELQ